MTTHTTISHGDFKPVISIGLPVHNGENYLASALSSLLKQDFGDFELIIADNASTDRTEEICRAYAGKDPRIRYVRHEENLGAAPNFNYTFEMARGAYFKWAAHDDELEPTFLRACYEALEANPHAVLAFPLVRAIGDTGEEIDRYESGIPDVSSHDVRKRFHGLVMNEHACYEVFGLIRTEVLAKTPLILSHVTSDRNLLAELGLHGTFVQVPGYLFLSRHHKQRSVAMKRHERLGWFDTKKRGHVPLPYWRCLYEFWRSVLRVKMPMTTKLACHAVLVRWALKWWRFLRGDLRIALMARVPRWRKAGRAA